MAALEAFFGGEKALDAEVLQEASPRSLRRAARGGPHRAHHHRGRRAQPGGHPRLAEAIQEAFSFTKLVVVVGVLKEKDAEEILRQLKESLGGLAEEFCFTQSNSPRAVPAAEPCRTRG